jgi:hypothetical protein
MGVAAIRIFDAIPQFGDFRCNAMHKVATSDKTLCDPSSLNLQLGV